MKKILAIAVLSVGLSSTPLLKPAETMMAVSQIPDNIKALKATKGAEAKLAPSAVLAENMSIVLNALNTALTKLKKTKFGKILPDKILNWTNQVSSGVTELADTLAIFAL